MIESGNNGYWYCTNCGSELKEDFYYCPWCGIRKDQKTLKDYIRKPSSKLVEAIKKSMEEESQLLDIRLEHLPKPEEHKKDCYYYHEEQDMGARIPTCLREKWLGSCPCEGCDKYIPSGTISRIAGIINGDIDGE